ncbi:hypothetical protein MMC21_004182 [Puttea exsequens]|nr:hypothetical protein [Puttea exsequens]
MSITTLVSGSSVTAPINGPNGRGIILTPPDPHMLIVFTLCEGRYTFLHLYLMADISLDPKPKWPKTAVLQAGKKKIELRRLRVKEGNDLYVEILSKKYLNLDFSSAEAKTNFCKELKELEDLRTTGFCNYERALLEKKNMLH